MISGSNEQLQQQLEYTLLKLDCHCWWISKMQCGREDTLEERYAIKFCFKLGKNATETYGILQTALGASCLNRASVFEWHKRFKEGRESIRDDERCGRSKEVRTPELIGQIKNFMDKDRRAQFDVSVGTVHTIIREELKMRNICAKFVSRMLREDQKEIRCHDSREMVELINSDLTVLDALVTCDESWIYCYDPRRPERANPPSNFWWSLFFLTAHALGSHWTVNKENYVEVLREFRKRFLGKMPALFNSGQWYFQQDNAPVHNSILVTDPLTKSINKVPHPPYSRDLAPYDFSLFPKLRGCRYETIEEMKEAVTKVIDMLTQGDFHGGLPEVVGTAQQVHCSWRRLFRRGLEFYGCTTNKNAHIKKSGNLFNEPCVDTF